MLWNGLAGMMSLSGLTETCRNCWREAEAGLEAIGFGGYLRLVLDLIEARQQLKVPKTCDTKISTPRGNAL